MTIKADKDLNLREKPPGEKYAVFTKSLGINNKLVLKGGLLDRLVDYLNIRAMRILYCTGRKRPDPEREYLRLTGNFRRIGIIARMFGWMGVVSRHVMRALLSSNARTLAGQNLFGMARGPHTLHEAAFRYFTLIDYYNFNFVIDSIMPDRITFRVLRCPAGYVSGDSMKVCMASNKWDRECARILGARIIVEDLIPEGCPSCKFHMVPEGRTVPDELRRYRRRCI